MARIGSGLPPGRARRPDRDRRLGIDSDLDERLCVAIVVLGVSAVTIWAAGEVAAGLFHGRFVSVGLGTAPRLLAGLLRHPARPALAWPPAIRAAIPGPLEFYAVLATLDSAVAACAVGGTVAVRATRTRLKPHEPATWALRDELRPLAVRTPGGGRLVLGGVGHTLIATESHQSVLAFGPTQSGKTTGLVIPALLEWEGPIVATSVKTDLLQSSMAWRARVGEVSVFDPASVTEVTSVGWSPLSVAPTWMGAKKVAAALCSVAREGSGGLDDAAFWYATAEKLLAPLLFAAAGAGLTMSDVVRWVDTQESDEVLSILDDLGVTEAVHAAEASFGREDRQKSSIYTTAETVLDVFSDPSVASLSVTSGIDPERFVNSGSDTLFLVAPAHDQARLRPLFVAIIRAVVDAAYVKASRQQSPLDPPLLVVLDEAANIAPLHDLDVIAATAASHGVQLVTVFQDFAQMEARYGVRGATVFNNHRAKIVLSGISDTATLQRMSELVGEEERPVASTTVESTGGVSTSTSTTPRRLATPDMLRRVPPGRAVLIYGHLPAALVSLRPYYAERELARRAAVSPAARLSPPRRRRSRVAWARRAGARLRLGVVESQCDDEPGSRGTRSEHQDEPA